MFLFILDSTPHDDDSGEKWKVLVCSQLWWWWVSDLEEADNHDFGAWSENYQAWHSTGWKFREKLEYHSNKNEILQRIFKVS